MKPDIKKYNPDVDYLRGLLKKSGYSQRGFAREFGIPERTFRQCLDRKNHDKIDYAWQYLLESVQK